MLGLLIVLRRRDAEVAAYFTDSAVMAMVLFLVGCVVATYLDVIRIANLAHFTGLGYGLLVGEIFYGRWPERSWKWAFYAAHLALVPAFYFVMHPTWSAQYHWYQAMKADDAAVRREHFAAAMRIDPGLSAPWRELATRQASEGDLLAAWKTLLNGLSYNRSDKASVELSRTLWDELFTEPQKQEALQILEEVFGSEAGAWKERLQIGRGPLAWSDLPRVPGPGDLERFRLDQPIELPATIDGMPEASRHDLVAPDVNPDDPQSAALGAAT
jgi:hypothetical protein